MKVYACVEWDPITETCSAHAYVDPPYLLPAMTAEEGAAIGWKLVVLFVLVRAVMMLREAARDRVA